jgi:hypothetical protein
MNTISLSSVAATIKTSFMQSRLVMVKAEVLPLIEYGGAAAFGFVYGTGGSAQNFAANSENVLMRNSINAENQRLIWWKVSDYLNAEWVDDGQTPAGDPVQFFSYTSSSSYGTPTNTSGSAVNVYRLQFTMYYEFRGIASS